MNCEFMQFFAVNLAKHGISVARFNFPYMQERERSGWSKEINTKKELEEHFKKVLLSKDKKLPLFLGGKGLGG